MNMSKENVVVKGKVRIEVTDKRTGKVISVSELENAFCSSGAFYVMRMIDTADLPQLKNKINLYDTSRSLIKTLTGTWGIRTDTGSAKQNTITVLDNTTDTYTVQFYGLSHDTQTLYENNDFCFKDASAKTKGSDQNLKVDWTVTVPYTSAPI